MWSEITDPFPYFNYCLVKKCPADNKENYKVPALPDLCAGKPLVTAGFLLQSPAIQVTWPYHAIILLILHIYGI